MHSETQHSSLVKPGTTLVFLGDSITEDPNGYVSLCARRLQDNRVINAGVSGNKANDMLARLDRDVLPHQPDWVLISVGINDVWHGFYDFDREAPLPDFDPERGHPLPQFERALRQMLERLDGVQTMLISPTVIGDDPRSRENRMLAQYVVAMKGLAAAEQVMYCPMHEQYWQAREQDPTAIFTTDGVHMSPAGATLMAGVVLRSLGVPAK